MEPVPTATSRTAPGAGRRIGGLDATARREERRTRLLDAALELIASDGYANTSIEQLCQTAYVGTRGFYQVFDSKEDCYLALLERITADISTRMLATLETVPDDHVTAGRTLLSTLAHALVDDPRVARASFGEASGISPAVERQRRANRRWAAGFLEEVWLRYGIVTDADARVVAIAVIGGLFELIADWLLEADPRSPRDVDQLIENLDRFYLVTTAGLARGSSEGGD